MGVEPLNGLAELGTLLSQRQTLAYPVRLCNQNQEPIMTVSMHEGKIVSWLEPGNKNVSLQRMLAWEFTMLFEGSNGHRLECVSIGSRRSFLASEIVAFSANGIVFAESVGTKAVGKNDIVLQIARKAGPTPRNVLLESFAGKSEFKVREAVTWILYTEEVYKKTREILPTNATVFLTCMGSAMRLYNSLHSEQLYQ